MPQQFTLETGARYAAELLHAWVLRVAAESRAAALPTLAGAAPLYRAAPATAVCFSFDDQFDGQISPPRILRNVDWTEVKYETGRSGERKLKPGLASSVTCRIVRNEVRGRRLLPDLRARIASMAL